MMRLHRAPDASVPPGFQLPHTASGKSSTLIAVLALTGSTSSIRFVPYETAYAPGFEDMRRRVPDTTRARQLVGWEPSYALDDILRSVIAHERTALDAVDA